MKRWTKDEIELLTAFFEVGYSHSEIANELDRTVKAVVARCHKLGLRRKYKETYINARHSCGHECPSNGNAKLTTEQYKLEIPNEDIEVLEEYINAHTKILHLHSCGCAWKATPHNIKQGSGCPVCAGRAVPTIEDIIEEQEDYLLYEDEIWIEEYINTI